MSIIIRPGKTFIKRLKRLSKKYRSLLSDLKALEADLNETPTLGVDLGNGLRKIRMKISDKGKGKSGGARVITHTTIVSVEDGIITLLTIYDKSEMESISDAELRELLDEIPR